MEGRRLIQKWPCRCDILSNGVPGVWWRGVLYPLLPAETGGLARIDVGAPPPQPTLSTHAVLSGEEASWVLVQGNPKDLEAARVALAGGGAIVTRHGRWLGEPVGDRDFDFFLRCEGWVDAETVDRLLSTTPTDGTQIGPAARLALLEQRLMDMRAELATLRAVLVGAQKAAEQPPPPPPSQEQTEPTVPYTELQEAISRADALEERLRNLASPSTRGVNRLKDEFAEALAFLRPDVTLLRDSLMVVTGEFSSRTGILRAIAELPSTGSRPESWKMLRGADRWWERHVNTGNSDLGRAYARFDTQARQWNLLVSLKGEQDKDIQWLKRTT
jgi:hypothetical protein